MSLVGAALKGTAAGVAGTLAMDLLWYSRYRRGGGTQELWAWETAAGVDSYDKAAAPAQVGRKAYKLVTGDDPQPDTARLMTDVMHWVTGVQWAAAYGVVASRTRHPVAVAAAFAPTVWLSSYAILGSMGIYKPIWKYDAKTLWLDLSAHLVYGAVTTGTYAALTR